MRIGILTQPLYCNYGGIIQCYALQTVLKRMGHETIILQREFDKHYTFKGACIYYAKHLIKLLLGRQSSWHYFVDPKKRDYIAQNTYNFIDKNIKPRSNHYYTSNELKQDVARQNLDAIIVGSDQVWRPDYSPCLPNYFLDFLEDWKTKRIAYAASFGSDTWTYSNIQTQICGSLLKQFNAVSVREQSAIELCKKHFGVNAIQTLDPTMLLEQDDYLNIIDRKERKRGELFCYVLDRSQEKKHIIAHIEKATHLKPFESMPELKENNYNLYGDIDKCVYPPLEDWISAFYEANMVVTDSFHGTIFSIIFNKPFWVIGNERRGMTRFLSLLSLFNLEDRLITTASLNTLNIYKTIDWKRVNEHRKKLQKESMDFLQRGLN